MSPSQKRQIAKNRLTELLTGYNWLIDISWATDHFIVKVAHEYGSSIVKHQYNSVDGFSVRTQVV